MSLAGLSNSKLYAEIAKRQRKLPRLKRKRAGIVRRLGTLNRKLATLNRRLAKVDSAIAAAGGSGGGSRGHARAMNKVSLATAMHSAMKGKTMTLGEVCAAVRKAGYKSNSPNFRMMVMQKLIAKKNKKLFKRVERGRYTTV